MLRFLDSYFNIKDGKRILIGSGFRFIRPDRIRMQKNYDPDPYISTMGLLASGSVVVLSSREVISYRWFSPVGFTMWTLHRLEYLVVLRFGVIGMILSSMNIYYTKYLDVKLPETLTVYILT